MQRRHKRFKSKFRNKLTPLKLPDLQKFDFTVKFINEIEVYEIRHYD